MEINAVTVRPARATGWIARGVAMVLLLAIWDAPELAAQDPAGIAVDLPYREFTLPNGLRVIVHEDHSTPVVSVNTWYHVGSKNERPGRTGFAHLFEHLMFEGSGHVAEGRIDELLEAAGGATPNGSTSEDRTNYYLDAPSNALEMLLYLEADRMGWLPDAMTEAKLDAQREVVKNERRQSYDNRPYGFARERLSAALYPVGHPYHHTTIGSLADLDAAELDDVLDFFRTYYAPNNATLAIAGDVSFDRVRELVTRYFGPIPRGPAVPPVEVPDASLGQSKYLLLEDDVQLPRLYKAWHTPPAFQAGDAAMDLVGSILADGKSSRLYRKLVYEDQIAQDVYAAQSSSLLGSTFDIIVTAKPGVDLTRIDAAVTAELRAIAETGISESEMERARNKLETRFVDALQNVGSFGGKADQLNGYLFFTGTPGYVQRDLERYRSLTPSALREALQRFLIAAPSVTLSVVPTGNPDLAVREPAS